jgi:hypothetical protein
VGVDVADPPPAEWRRDEPDVDEEGEVAPLLLVLVGRAVLLADWLIGRLLVVRGEGLVG